MALGLAGAVGLVACGRDGSATGDDWQFTRSTDGDTTTVITTSGSKWPGPAHLREELSIGVLEGEDPYMFGRIGGLWATEQRIYVVDSQAPAVRVYDRDGTYLMDVGAPGQGPGEYERPRSVVVHPDGRIFVRETGMSARISVFDASGTFLETWSPETRGGGGMVLTSDGTMYAAASVMPDRSDPSGSFVLPKSGWAPLDDSGAAGEVRLPPDFGVEPEVITVAGRDAIMIMTGALPFSTAPRSALASDGSIVAGLGDRYRFEILDPDGGKTVVERYWDPVGVQPEEADYFVRGLEARVRELDPEWTFDDEVPANKPAFDGLFADRSGRIWVSRQGPGERAPGCTTDFWDPGWEDETPCWTAPRLLDVFDLEGNYLGDVVLPEGLDFDGRAYIEDDLFVTTLEDDLGTLRVMVYRIVVRTTASDT